MQNQITESFTPGDDFSEYENCTFKNINFSNLILNSIEFTDCTFVSCDFSMAKLDRVSLSKIKFIQCKLLGIDFGKCSSSSFSVSFDNCVLNYCLFLKLNVRKTIFKNCSIKEAVFSESNLSEASFLLCDLSNTVFEKCNLTHCDFRTAQNYSINPSENKIKNALFSYPGVLGLLNQFNIKIEL